MMQPLLPTLTDHLPAPLLHPEWLRVQATAGSCRQMRGKDHWASEVVSVTCSPTVAINKWSQMSEFLFCVVHGEKKGKVEILGLFWNFL